MSTDQHPRRQQMRFRQVDERYEHSGTTTVSVAEVRPGHTVTRERWERRTGAGHKGRVASVEWDARYVCSCGARIVQATTVAQAMEAMRHFEDDAERAAYEAAEAAKRDRIIAALGGTR